MSGKGYNYNHADIYQTIGKNIRHYRELNGLTQEELAALLGVSRITLNHMEKSNGGVTIHRLMDIAGLFGIELSDLVSDRPIPDNRPKLNKRGCHNCMYNKADHCTAVNGILPEDNFICKKYKMATSE